MSDEAKKRVEIDAPAKLNLGLEVIDRRDDGFHEIATIFVAVDLVDRLILAHDDAITLSCDDPDLTGTENLALRAVNVLRDETSYSSGARLDLRKQIPLAAGLGGASSDAAAALLGARELWHVDVPGHELLAMAARLGSDVPFFLRGGCALGRGRGEILAPLPVPSRMWFVLVVPETTTRNKTPRLYASLCPEDFSDGDRITAQAARLAAGLPPDPALLGNAFARPLSALAPALAELLQIMREAGAPSVALSGAGPAHYTLVSSEGQAQSIATRLRNRLGHRARVFVTQPVPPRGPL